MDHVELKPYPFPEGMAIPRLMPFQEYPWNGDGYLAAEVLRLKEAHGLNVAVETGTCLGSTAMWLGENFEQVVTIEVHKPYHDIAKARIGEGGNVRVVYGSTVATCFRTVGACAWGSIEREEDDLLETLFWYPSESRRYFVFLDAHWGEDCPLLRELSAIATGTCNYSHEHKPCILIHDFQVPGTDFSYDSMPDGRPFNLELIFPYMQSIYGSNGWNYNFPTQVEGAKRGWISIEPA